MQTYKYRFMYPLTLICRIIQIILYLDDSAAGCQLQSTTSLKAFFLTRHTGPDVNMKYDVNIFN